MVFETLKWVGGIDGYLEFIDQRRLPGHFEKLKCQTVGELYEAIKTLAVRGAPAIGVSAGFGICLCLRSLEQGTGLGEAIGHLNESAEYLATARPTAVNLFWALERMKRCAQRFIGENSESSLAALRQAVLTEAQSIYDEDKRMCRQIGLHGQRFIKSGAGVLTHCNAGALATACSHRGLY